MAAWEDLETKAKEAFIDDHFELAVDLYSQAISLNPKDPKLFVDRAQANIKLHNFTATHNCVDEVLADLVKLGTPDADFVYVVEAVADANRAIELDPSMYKAYLRKGTACIKLEEYQTAKAAFEIGASLASGDSSFINLIKECDERIAEEAGELPRQLVDKALTDNVPSASQTSGETDVPLKDAEPVNNLSDPVKTLPSSSKPKYRHEFYQKPEEVVVTIFAKGVPANSVAVDFGEQILSVTVDVPDEEAYIFQPRLYGKIVPAKCKYEVLSTKIEIRLAKAEAIHWTSLEFTKNISVPQKTCVSSGAQRPVYPTSTSKSKAVDWDKLEAEVKKEEKEEKLDGDAALNKFFRDIYQDADEDTRRAMRKSFVESNGTVLSTNWKEVGLKKVEGSAPDGMEMRKWEY